LPQTCYAVPNDADDWREEYANCHTEDGMGSMRNGEIVFSPRCQEGRGADWLFVMDLPAWDFVTFVPRERRILFLSEPPMIRKYDITYLEQFGVVVSPYPIDGYGGRLFLGNPCLGWFAGLGTNRGSASQVFKKLSDVENFAAHKTREISIISSLKKKQKGHQRRVVFMNALMEHYGNKMDYYGRDFAFVDDKIHAIAPYKYHIAVENCCLENYWTEKLADAWIGWSLPIYCGDPAIARKIPDPKGVEVIDVEDIPGALRKIDGLLRDDVYPGRLSAIEKCRKWAIKESNRFEKVCAIIESTDESVTAIPKLAAGVVIRRQRRRFRGLGEVLSGAVSSARGMLWVGKLRRNYKKIADAQRLDCP
jgi:hypothetical protein